MSLLNSILQFLWGLFGRKPPAPTPSPPSAQSTWFRPRFDLKEWTGDGSPPPMTWKRCHPRTRSIFKAELTCSNGHAISLRGHSISSDGTVTPSVVCTTPGCDFHDFIRLNSWRSGALH